VTNTTTDPVIYTPKEIREMADRAIAYLLSPEGQEKLRKSAEESRRLAEAFRKARDIPWEKLHEPFTI
jgi:hypothetical protein